MGLKSQDKTYSSKESFAWLKKQKTVVGKLNVFVGCIVWEGFWLYKDEENRVRHGEKEVPWF